MDSDRALGGLLRPVPSLNFICGRIRDVRSSLAASVAEGGILEEVSIELGGLGSSNVWCNLGQTQVRMSE